MHIFFNDPTAAACLREAGIPVSQIFCLEQDLSVGNIAGTEEPLELLAAVQADEPLLLWLGQRPVDICGLHWLAFWLEKWQTCYVAISVVWLPRFEERPNGVVIVSTHWGEMLLANSWSQYAAQAERLPANFIRDCAWHWQDLQLQNTPLRTVVNGQLLGVAADFYDCFVRQAAAELSQKQEDFRKLELIGSVLGGYSLGISDELIASRVEVLIAAGELALVQPALPGGPNDWSCGLRLVD